MSEQDPPAQSSEITPPPGWPTTTTDVVIRAGQQADARTGEQPSS